MRGILKIERSIVKISDVLRTRFKDTCPLLEKYYLIKKKIHLDITDMVLRSAICNTTTIHFLL